MDHSKLDALSEFLTTRSILQGNGIHVFIDLA